MGGVKAPGTAHLEPQPFSGPQVLLVQFKGTGRYYAIKALKKQEVLSRDEIERWVVMPPGTWPGPAAGSDGWPGLLAPEGGRTLLGP